MPTDITLQDSLGNDLWKIACVSVDPGGQPDKANQFEIQLLQNGVWVSYMSLNTVNGGVAVNRHPGMPNQGGLSIGLGKKDGSDKAGGINYLKMFSDEPLEQYFQINIGMAGDPDPNKRYAFLEAVDQSVNVAPWVLNPQGGGVGIGVRPAANTLFDMYVPQGTPLVQHGLQGGIVQYWAGFKANDYNYYFGTGGTSAADLGKYGVYLPNTGNSWVSISDERLKKNVEPSLYGLDAVLKLEPVTAQWKHSDSDRTFLTLIAQRVQEVIPEAVHIGAVTEDAPDGQLGVDYSAMVMPLIKAVQELSKRLDALDNGALK